MNKQIVIVGIIAFVIGLIIGLAFRYFIWKDKSVICNKPYIRVGIDCCLDRDDNKVCDRDDATICDRDKTSTTTSLLPPQIYIVAKVEDGDTIILSNEETVRLLGINAPERGESCSKEVAERLRELVEGKKVRLEKDIEDRDMYNRLLRYVYIDNVFVNAEMIEEGYALVYLYNDTLKHKDLLIGAENKAKMAKRCMWKVAPSQCTDCITISGFHEDADGNDCDNLNDEYVTFKNVCTFSCKITGWSVKDKASRTPYKFSDFTLNPGATVTPYTGCGTNTNTKVYWCSSGRDCNAIWNTDGDTLYLRDEDGNLVMEHTYTGFEK